MNLLQQKRAVVSKAMSWSGRALRQQQRPNYDGSHYAAETVWTKGDAVYDSAQNKVVRVIPGKVPGTNVDKVLPNTSSEESGTPKKPKEETKAEGDVTMEATPERVPPLAVISGPAMVAKEAEQVDVIPYLEPAATLAGRTDKPSSEEEDVEEVPVLETDSSQEDDKTKETELLDMVPMTDAFARMMKGDRNDILPNAAINTPYEWKPTLSRPDMLEAVQQELGAASSTHAQRPEKRGAETAGDQPSASSSTVDEQPVLKTPRGTRSSQ